MRPILLATDNSNDVFGFWMYHKQCDIQNRVEVLSDGAGVIRYLQGDRARFPLPALLVASLKMPQMGALQLLEHLHLAAGSERDFATVVLIDERDRNPELVKSAFKLGVDSFLVRPMEKKEFCRVMGRFQTITMDECCAGNGPLSGLKAELVKDLRGKSGPGKSAVTQI